MRSVHCTVYLVKLHCALYSIPCKVVHCIVYSDGWIQRVGGFNLLQGKEGDEGPSIPTWFGHICKHSIYTLKCCLSQCDDLLNSVQTK